MWKMIPCSRPKPAEHVAATPAVPDDWPFRLAEMTLAAQARAEAIRSQPFIEAGGQRLDLVDVGVRDRDGALLLLIGGRSSGVREMYVVMPDGIRPQ